MKLIVVESPTKAKTLTKFLGKDYKVIPTMGHIRDLPEKKLGIEIVGHDFVPEYVLMTKKQEAIDRLKKEAVGAEKIFLATDPDREGEAIAWHTAFVLGFTTGPVAGSSRPTASSDVSVGVQALDGTPSARATRHSRQPRKVSPCEANSGFPHPPFARIVFHEITKSAIEKALANPGEIDLHLVDAQQARRVLDRLVGYKLSPLLWRKIRRGLSAGRVQSVAVRLIVDREREIEKFVAKEYWEILTELKRHIGGLKEGVPSFWANLAKINGKTVEIVNGTQAKEITDELEKANYEIAGVDKKETAQNPVPPFTTSTLQQRAVQKLGFSSKRTMRAAQSLYEHGLITYHRTDSLNLANEAVTALRQYINSTWGEKYLPEKPRFYKTKSKVAQEAHEAIRPTNIQLKIQSEKLKVGRDEEKLYDLIWKRAVACQMSAAIWDQTKVRVQATGAKNIYELRAEGKVIKFDGWLIAYGGAPDVGMELPELKTGDDLDLLKVQSEQKFTQPPARYNEASLIKALEERGIGRPSTYAPIVSTIQDRQYVEKTEGRFQPTALGTTVNDFLLEYFTDIFAYQFTAKMEDELDDIANGKLAWMSVINDFYAPFAEKLTVVTKVAERVQVPTEATGEKCPKCQEGQLVIRIGRFGKFLSCSRFPDCDYTAPYIQKLEGVKCPKCGGDIVIKKTKKGKQFYGCSNYPKCNWASWRKPK